MNYARIPDLVQAVQWRKATDTNGPMFNEVPPWLMSAIRLGPRPGGTMRMLDVIHVFTKRGRMIAEPGDWIVHKDGRLWVVEEEDFPNLYEPQP